MKETKKDERPKKLREVNEEELRRVMGGALGCGGCVCGSGSAQLDDCLC